MATAAADDSAHGKPVFDDKLTEDVTPKDHRSDEEIAATIKEDQFALGSGITVLPMTVGIARGKLEGITTILSEAHTCTGRLPVCLLTYDQCSPLRRIMVSGEVFCTTVVIHEATNVAPALLVFCTLACCAHRLWKAASSRRPTSH